ncbi:MAG: OmpA family protein [Cyclobacteriaceae bacterium]|nr:OmpA family protein [Cyclobacteriaceae bacterium]
MTGWNKLFTLFALTILWSCGAEKAAQKKFNLGEYQVAIEKYGNILSKNNNHPDANYFVAEAYRMSNRARLAEPYYKKALSSGVRNDSIEINYAYALKANGKYEDAKQTIEAYLKRAKDEDMIRRANEIATGLESLDQIKEIKNYYKVKNLQDINTPATEYSPIYNNGYLYLTSNRDNDKIYKATGQGYTNIFRVKTKGANVDISSFEALSEAINTININEGTITFSPDGKIMVFARGNGSKRNSGYDVDLYMSRERNGQWTAPQMLGTAVNQPDSWESCPAFSRDGRTLYFASNRKVEGAQGGVDLYSARMSSRGRFSKAQNLGPAINTSGNDMFPYISDDGHLYFASDGHPGFGGLDLYKVTRSSGQLEIENLGEPMNSSSDDFGIYLFKMDRGFFASNRESGKGDDDIYTFVNEDPDLKIINYYLSGITMTKDDDDNMVVLPNTNVKILDYNNQILDETTTGSNGEFVFRVYEHENYNLIGENKEGNAKYLTSRILFTTVGKGVNRDTLTQLTTDITYDTLLLLEKQEVNKIFVLENIYYDLDRWEIRSDAAIELDKLVTLLSDNPEIKIELSSHTDSRQSDSYNQRLSQRRAKSAVDYLVEQGIDPIRLVAKGYGESTPFSIKSENGNEIVLTEAFINSKTDIDEREELHQMNRRTEFKILEITESDENFNEDRFFDNN